MKIEVTGRIEEQKQKTKRMDSSAILDNEIKSIKTDLIQKHIQLGMKASGQWIDSLNVQTKGLTSTLYGQPYTEQLVNGREPGKFPPIDMIKKWIYDKGISVVGKSISISSLAFLIARKIANEGTKYFQQGGTDLVESVITPERIQSILDKVSEFHINNFFSQITGVFEELKPAA